jgi:hypothetical protein
LNLLLKVFKQLSKLLLKLLLKLLKLLFTVLKLLKLQLKLFKLWKLCKTDIQPDPQQMEVGEGKCVVIPT